ncbi:MAG: NupC/NupG family nucleoside CNT transporter [Campylobacteraceae bacterium 4484_4]|uniref:NupC/NupG family nucleoside CNT transporter n=1 Tax=Hydrogenimonas sp. TaxID=2231112 RepID=UPI000A0DC7FF|nr:NupC/NupG family nucleoside CNT transporter [Hydrogenimonas sp.]OQX72455.1 MAG: NupC/NupG family nucleoside CNT transporter [Campylobacteraceae bacterium 4484_4]
MQQVLIGLVGVVVLLSIAFLFSSNKRAINPRTIFGALALQALIPAFVIYTDSGAVTLQTISNGVQAVIDSAHAGIGFVFGSLADVKQIGFIFAIKVLPVIIFFAALMSVLYYLKIMQVVIKVMGGGLQKLLKTSPVESLSAAANIFVGQTEAPLVVKPYLSTMTKSELFAIMSGGLASVAGAVLAGYASMGISLNYLIAASFMAAPGGLLMAKMLEPETEEPKIEVEEKIKEEQEEEMGAVNVIDAAAIGASDGLRLAANVGAMLIAFVALIALLNMMFGGIGGLFGYENITIQQMLGYLFAPIAFILGVPWEHAIDVGSLLGIKLIINEFVAYIDLVKLKASLDPHSMAIATVALCGFANLSSLAILLGGLGVLAPNRRGDIARMGMKAVLAGTLSNFMSATLVGIFIAIKMM